MADLFQAKYRVKSTRLKDWDYSHSGWYFVTICVKNFKNCLSIINNDKVSLNRIGEIINRYWLGIPTHYHFVSLDEYIIMPNHIHGIIIINKSNVETCHATSLPQNYKNKSLVQPQRGSLSIIINQLKGSVKRECNKLNINFSWQPRFYEHIIRNEKAYWAIKNYIYNNPLRWNLDEYY